MALLRVSRLFAAYNPAETGSTLFYTCPPGHRAILRSMDLATVTAVTTRSIQVSLYTGGEDVFLFCNAILTAEAPVKEWRGHLVLNEGEQIFSTSGDVGFWATGSGALMPLQN
jgi:hypothetical protein